MQPQPKPPESEMGYLCSRGGENGNPGFLAVHNSLSSLRTCGIPPMWSLCQCEIRISETSGWVGLDGRATVCRAEDKMGV